MIVSNWKSTLARMPPFIASLLFFFNYYIVYSKFDFILTIKKKQLNRFQFHGSFTVNNLSFRFY